jgi:hypothetical protein
MLFNCERCDVLTPQYIDDETHNPLMLDSWGKVGTFTSDWNHCVGYAQPRTDAKLYHFTQGIPYWPEVRGLPEDQIWDDEYNAMLKSCDWADLMLKSVHAKPVLKRMLSKYGLQVG